MVKTEIKTFSRTLRVRGHCRVYNNYIYIVQHRVQHEVWFQYMYMRKKEKHNIFEY